LFLGAFLTATAAATPANELRIIAISLLFLFLLPLFLLSLPSANGK